LHLKGAGDSTLNQNKSKKMRYYDGSASRLEVLVSKRRREMDRAFLQRGSMGIRREREGKTRLVNTWVAQQGEGRNGEDLKG